MIFIVDAWDRFIDNVKLRRFVVLVLLIVLLWLMSSLINIILLTFILTFIMVGWRHFVHRWIPDLSPRLLIVLTYALLLAVAYWAVTAYLPVLIDQIVKLMQSLTKFYDSRQGQHLFSQISQYVDVKSLIPQFKHGSAYLIQAVSDISDGVISFGLSFALSFFLSFDFKETRQFAKRFLTSDFDWLFQDIAFFGEKFVNTFGVVLEAQFFIAVCNTILTTIGLFMMGMPQIFALSLIVFIFSLVPVAGVLISLIPLSFIAYSSNGINGIVDIIVMISAIHLLESYVLNPHFMARQTKIPVPFTFIVLIVSEHFWSIWGLIIGVPIFAFFLDIMGVKKIGIDSKPHKEPDADAH